ncbi:hypothetical protein OV450_0880 [Actinobacteria bacterium OV450]|nr:hypothetical protein OV450_0880 [Actinobacteria bacterium OV450]
MPSHEQARPIAPQGSCDQASYMTGDVANGAGGAPFP